MKFTEQELELLKLALARMEKNFNAKGEWKANEVSPFVCDNINKVWLHLNTVEITTPSRPNKPLSSLKEYPSYYVKADLKNKIDQLLGYSFCLNTWLQEKDIGVPHINTYRKSKNLTKLQWTRVAWLKYLIENGRK